ESDLEALFDIRSYAVELSAAHKIHKHSHDWHQLIYASHGVMTVNTTTGSWVVPSRRAVWVPAGIEHEVEMSASVSVRTIYLRAGLSDLLPKECCVVNVSPLLRELILRTVEIGMLNRTVETHKHLIDVILDQFRTLPTIPLNLPMPADVRALRVAKILRENPGDAKSLDHLTKEIGASKRTIERLFQSETEMTFGKWRQQLRMLHALRLLAAGETVTTAALEVGYDSTSAFISAFRTTLGTTPGRYYAEGRRQRSGFRG
ncbi:MAG TPA: helix-turn-helix transcriptional regulator, partial [Pyrinomonadaceae bacterium]